MEERSDWEDVLKLDPFCAFSEHERARAARLGQLRHLRRGVVLHYQGDDCRACAVVVRGALRSLMYRGDESSVSLGVAYPGEWIGIVELMLAAPNLSDQIAQTESLLLVFDQTAFDAILAIRGAEAFFLKELAKRYYNLHSRMEIHSPRDRILRWIEERKSETGRIRLTQETLAQEIGLTRETVNRHLKGLEREGALRLERGLIVIKREAISKFHES